PAGVLARELATDRPFRGCNPLRSPGQELPALSRHAPRAYPKPGEWAGVTLSSFLALEVHLQELIPSLAVSAHFPDLVPSLLVESDREPDLDPRLLVTEVPPHAPLDELGFYVERLASDIVSPPAVPLGVLIVGHHREGVMHHDLLPGASVPGRAAALDEQDGAADLALDLLGDGKLAALPGACGGPAVALPVS